MPCPCWEKDVKVMYNIDTLIHAMFGHPQFIRYRVIAAKEIEWALWEVLDSRRSECPCEAVLSQLEAVTANSVVLVEENNRQVCIIVHRLQ